MSRKLTVCFSEEQVRLLQEYQKRLVLTRYIQMSNANLQDSFCLVLAWAVTDIKMSLSMEWGEAYSVYAARDEAEAGTVVMVEACKEAFPKGFLYTYKGGYFEETPYVGEEDFYYIKNNAAGGGMFGLAQALKINGKETGINPVNGRLMLPKEEAFFVVTSEVGICLGVQAEEKEILSVSKNAVTKVSLEQDSEKKMGYDSNTQEFYQMS